MTSPKQAEANRQNGKKGHGPATDAGKKKSRMNALKHGLTSRDAVLRGESQEEYDELRSNLLAEHEPIGTMERFSVDEMALCMWNLMRVVQMRREVIEILSDRVRREAELEAIKDDGHDFLVDIEEYAKRTYGRLGIEKLVQDDVLSDGEGDKTNGKLQKGLLELLPDHESLAGQVMAKQSMRTQAQAKATLIAIDGPTLGEVFMVDARDGDTIGKLHRYETTWRNRLTKAAHQLDERQERRLRVSARDETIPS